MHLIKWNKEVLEFQKPEKKWETLMNNEYSLILLTAIINSKLTTYFFSKFLSTDTLQGSYSSIYPEDLRQIPIKTHSTITYLIEDLANQIIIAKKQDYSSETVLLETQIDQLVYQLYNLTAEEIAIIENGIK
jgi:adenine-specific DNA-methyltransferase